MYHFFLYSRYTLYKRFVMLFVVPTPIGNIDDITLRALKIFAEHTVFICEDTRSTRKLLWLLRIDYSQKQFFSLTSHTQSHSIQKYLDMSMTQDIILVTDAGTPWLSDPGKVFIQQCAQNNVPYTVFPGANALVPAVVAAAFPTHRFRFLGFLPQKKWRQTLLREIVDSREAVFLYESVHRVQKTCMQLKELGFSWKVFLARELSKMFEQLVNGTLDDVIAQIDDGTIPMKWEFVMGFWPQ